jgi:high-affinity iron transporter
MAPFINAYLVVMRESFEAVLVLFLIYTGLSRQGIWKTSRNYIWMGIATGLVASLGFGYAMLHFDDIFESGHVQLLQAVFPLLAAGLMFHMVFWMAKHSAEINSDIKKTLHSGNNKTLTWGLLALVAYTITREGFETVVYLYGLSMSQKTGTYSWIGFSFVFGVLSSLGIMYAISKTAHFMRIKSFFKITNLFLLGAAASMLASGINKLIELEYLSPGLNPLWDSSVLLGTDSFLGKLATQLVGYTPMPSLTLVLAYAGFWLAAFYLFKRKDLKA